MTTELVVCILAAGKGTRMRNGLPKVLHPLAGRTLIGHVLEVAAALEPVRIVVVLGSGMDEAAAEVAKVPSAPTIAIQDPALGTGHAVMAAGSHLPASGTVLVLYGDTPLLSASTLQALLERRDAADAAVAVLGIRPPDTAGYGRLRFDGERLVAVVEERHAEPELKLHGMCNSGVMAFDLARLGALLDALPLRPEKHEYYLTDTVGLAVEKGWACTAYEGPWADGVGVNSQTQLAAAMQILQQRLRSRALEAGVVMSAPETVFLAADTELAPGVIIEPYTVFGPGVRVASGAVIHGFSHLEGATIGEGAAIGPFARLRRGSIVGRRAKIGNFVETKAAVLGDGAKANHLTYLGDAEIGAGANIGAGTITCNYDGFAKHRTTIGPGAFIGSNTALVAPIRIGAEAVVGAGGAITRDVPDEALAIARAPQETRPGAATTLRERFRRRKPG